MAWPDDRDLPVEVQAAFGADLTADPGTWSWTDLSSRLQSAPISMRVGRSSGAEQVSPGTCSVTLDNDDSALTPLHPLSPYWPNVELGTPLRVRLRWAEDAFGRTVSNGWGTADSGQAWSVGGADVSAFSTSAGVAKHTHTTVNTLRRATLATSLLDTEQVIDVATSAMLTGAALVTGLVFRYSDNGSDYYWLRCEFNSGGSTVMLKISKCVNGGFTDIATLNPVAGLAYAANTYLRVRASVVGSQLAMKAWNPAGPEPSGWQLTATDTAITVPGGVGIQSWLVLGNTNTLPVTASHKSYAVQVERFSGFADQWQPTFHPIADSKAASVVQVTASGILRRLSQGAAPLRSALRRKILASSPVAYWPLEGGPDLVGAESAVADGEPMRTKNSVAPQFGGEDGPPGSGSLPDLSSHGSLIAPMPSYTHTGQWQVEFWFRTMTGDSLNFTASVPLQWDTPDGSVVAWDCAVFVGRGARNPGLGNIGFDAGGYSAPPGGGEPNESYVIDALRVGSSDVSPWPLFPIPSVQGSWHQVRMCAEQIGSSVKFSFYLDNVLTYTKTASGWTIGPITRVIVNPLQGRDAYLGVDGVGLSSVGHVAIYDTVADPGTYWAGLGHEGEGACDRILRLCTEEGVPVQIDGAVSGEPMGPQQPKTLADLIGECADADGGSLSERQFGLAYWARDQRYNLSPAMVIDLADYRVSAGGSSSVLAPALDDQGVRNDWTISRPGGLEARAVDEGHARRHGTYDDSAELNLATDDRLLDHASWRVRLGTIEGLRETSFPIDLAANPDLIDAWMSCTTGSRILRTNPPAQYPPGDLDRLVEGWTETIGPRSWMVQVSVSSGSAWDVATVDGPERVAADGTTLAANITTGALSVQITSTSANGRWTTNPADFPMDLQIGAEQVTATAISGSGLTQTVTLSARAVNGVSKAWAAGTEVNVWQPVVLAL